MTKEERAVEILENELACVRNVDCERSECRNCNLVMPEHDITEALQMAIKALKQEPKQVELEGDGYSDGKLIYDWGKCPNCGWDFEDGDKDWEEPYCCHCGQKLHWFENQEVEE